MKLSFLRYSIYVLSATLSVENTLSAMEEDAQESALARTRTIRPKRQRSITAVDVSEAKIDQPISMMRTRSSSSGKKSADETIPMQRSVSQRSDSQQDSQWLHNQDFDSQTLREARERYNAALATGPDVNAQDEEGDVSARKKLKSTHGKSVRFKDKLRICACENVVAIEVGAAGTSNGVTIVEKKTASYHDALKEKEKSDKRRRDLKKAIYAKIEQKWNAISEIERHPIFTHKFNRALNAIRIGFKKFKEAKIFAKSDGSLTDVFQKFSVWEKSNLNPDHFVAGLRRLGEATIDQLETFMNGEHALRMQELNAKRAEFLAENVFDCLVQNPTRARDSDEESTVIDDTNSDAGSTDSILYFQDMTDMQYFDSLVVRYGVALTTFKEDLVRLKSKSGSFKSAQSVKRKNST